MRQRVTSLERSITQCVVQCKEDKEDREDFDDKDLKSPSSYNPNTVCACTNLGSPGDHSVEGGSQEKCNDNQ